AGSTPFAANAGSIWWSTAGRRRWGFSVKRCSPSPGWGARASHRLFGSPPPWGWSSVTGWKGAMEPPVGRPPSTWLWPSGTWWAGGDEAGEPDPAAPGDVGPHRPGSDRRSALQVGPDTLRGRGAGAGRAGGGDVPPM